MRKAVDSYSAFFENDRKTPTGLDQYVNGVNKALTLTGRSKMHACIIVGVAFDYCVRFTAEDARLYFERVVVLENATRAVGLGDSREAAREALQSRGVEISYG
jgi:nicotinamidase/pyrazinamidase